MNRSGAGFTLVELLISIAIIGILSAMMFTNFSKEKERTAIKSAVRQLQTDLQKMQANAQGGVATSGVIAGGYGVYLVPTSNSYTLFADNSTGSDIGRYVPQPGGTDQTIRTVPIPGVKINQILDGVPTSITNVSIVYSIPDGTATIKKTATIVNTLAKVYLKSDTLGVCYAITITKGIGTVSQRKLDSC